MRLPAGYTAAAEFPLGMLPPHLTVTVELSGRFAAPTSSGLAGGPVVEFRPASGGTYVATGVAARGDRLRFSIELSNTGFQPVRVHLRAAIEPHHPADVVRVSAIVPEPGVTGVLGTATLHSEKGRLISLSVVPGTTEYLQAQTKCSKGGLVMHLANGIQNGGLLVGDVGGFLPFDPCHGVEFTRFVDFDAQVR
jgi:hypothetical protein